MAARRERASAPPEPAELPSLLPSEDLESDRQRIRVRGLVSANGQPADGLDVFFRGAGDAEEAGRDWDMTDEDGRFEVRLPAARYDVFDEEGRWLARLTLGSAVEEYTLDIDLPLCD